MLIYGIVKNIAEVIVEVINRYFGDQLNLVVYWSATKGDVGNNARQLVRSSGPTVILVTAACATGVNLADVGLVVAFHVQDASELQQVAGRANRDGSRLAVPVLICFDEATLKLPTFSPALRRLLAAHRRGSSGCLSRQLTAEMIPPSDVMDRPGRCGACTNCDSAYRCLVDSWVEGGLDDDPLASEPTSETLLESPVVNAVIAGGMPESSDEETGWSDEIPDE